VRIEVGDAPNAVGQSPALTEGCPTLVVDEKEGQPVRAVLMAIAITQDCKNSLLPLRWCRRRERGPVFAQVEHQSSSQRRRRPRATTPPFSAAEHQSRGKGAARAHLSRMALPSASKVSEPIRVGSDVCGGRSVSSSTPAPESTRRQAHSQGHRPVRGQRLGTIAPSGPDRPRRRTWWRRHQPLDQEQAARNGQSFDACRRPQHM